MQFNSYIFILVFVPAFILSYFLLSRINYKFSKFVIIAFGIWFYLYGGVALAAYLGISLIINLLSALLIKRAERFRKLFLTIAVLFNVGLLLYVKYYNFAMITIMGENVSARETAVPLGLSFFTFQQIMYVVSVYRKEIENVKVADYFCYILFFPKLIMGPLAEPKDFIDQLNNKELKRINWENIACGIKLFGFGLFKKMVLADTFAKAVSWGFGNLETATSGDLFLVMLFYTFEIYFDFSGYSDMAVGISQMVNISLPMNFDSPYKAMSIQDFWKRWHMSLTGFLRKYVYFPLGGSRRGTVRTCINIMLVYLISGIWHGANWTFILWGCLYGILQIIERIFVKAYNRLHCAIKWIYSFFTINILWLLFRAESITQWGTILGKMFSFQNMGISPKLINSFVLPETSFLIDKFDWFGLNKVVKGLPMLVMTVSAFLICLIPENNYRNLKKLNAVNMILCAIAFVWAFLCLSSESVFVYYNF